MAILVVAAVVVALGLAWLVFCAQQGTLHELNEISDAIQGLHKRGYDGGVLKLRHGDSDTIIEFRKYILRKGEYGIEFVFPLSLWRNEYVAVIKQYCSKHKIPVEIENTGGDKNIDMLYADLGHDIDQAFGLSRHVLVDVLEFSLDAKYWVELSHGHPLNELIDDPNATSSRLFGASADPDGSRVPPQGTGSRQRAYRLLPSGSGVKPSGTRGHNAEEGEIQARTALPHIGGSRGKRLLLRYHRQVTSAFHIVMWVTIIALVVAARWTEAPPWMDDIARIAIWFLIALGVSYTVATLISFHKVKPPDQSKGGEAHIAGALAISLGFICLAAEWYVTGATFLSVFILAGLLSRWSDRRARA